MKLCTVSPASYRIAKYREEEVWRSHQRIQEFLQFTPSCDEQTLNFLAQPVSKAGRVEWRSDFLQSATLMSELAPQAKARCEQIVTQTLQQLKLIAERHPDWAGLLSASLDIASQEDIYYDSELERVAVVNWGAKRKGMGNTSAYSFNVANTAPVIPTGAVSREVVQQEERPNQVEPNLEVQPISEGVIPESISNPPMAVEGVTPTPSETVNTPPHPKVEPAKPVELEQVISPLPSGAGEEALPESLPREAEPPRVQTETIVTPPPPPSPPSRGAVHSQDGPKRSEPVIGDTPKPRGFWQRLKKALLWLLGLLLLLLLFLLALSQCGGSRGIPEEPGHCVRIDSADIRYDSDSIRQIVGNRVNIYVEEKGRVEEFMEAFLKAYPQDYSILYYDTVVQRVQVQVPEEQREQFKQQLSSKMQGFKLIAWDEAMFAHGSIPNDPDFSDREHSWYFDCVRAYGAWDKGMGNDTLLVAIIDNGFDLKHPELVDRVADQYNVLTRQHEVFSDKGDPHGTHVAATAVGSANNATGVSGIAPHCRLIAIQVANDKGQMSTTSVMDGVIYAILHGAKVINLSLGANMAPMQIFSEADQVNFMNSYGLEEAKVWDKIYAMAEHYGATIVLAGGNDSVLVGLDPMQRSSRAIKVSAVDPRLNVAGFSNYGHLSTISAPGVAIYNAFPNGQYEAINGTSMAAPIVTGGIALIKSKYHELTTGQIAELIRHTGLPLSGNVGPLLQLDKALSVGDAGGDMRQVPDPNAGLPIDETLPPTAPNFPGGPVYRAPDAPTVPGDPLLPYYPNPDAPNTPSEPGVIGNPEGNNPMLPRPKEPTSPCPDVRQRIDSLRRVIRELEESCQERTGTQDTLRLGEYTTLADLSGHWRSTTDLYASLNNEPVELYFHLKADGTGTITYKEPATQHSYTAPLAVKLGQAKLEIQQLEPARSSQDPNASYNKHNFHGEANASGGIARCYATSAQHTRVKLVKFNMIRISK